MFLPQWQKFQTDDVKSFKNPDQELSLVDVIILFFNILFLNDRQKVTKVKCKINEPTKKQSLFVE